MPISSIINGRPTRTQVDKLFERVKSMKDGEVISHGHVSDLIGESLSSSRYRTVITVTRRRILRELGVDLASERTVGYRRATGFDQVRHGVGTVGQGVRRIAKGVDLAASVSDERLPEGMHRKLRDFVVERAKYLSELAKTQRKELMLTVGKPELLPR